MFDFFQSYQKSEMIFQKFADIIKKQIQTIEAQSKENKKRPMQSASSVNDAGSGSNMKDVGGSSGGDSSGGADEKESL